MTTEPNEVLERKRALRERSSAARAALADQDARSERIRAAVVGLAEYRTAQVVHCYVSVHDEVRTEALLADLLAAGKQVVVPWCVRRGELGLFRLTDTNQLAPGRFGLQEPRVELRQLPANQAVPGDLDLVLLPGVAFDRRGGRLGHGAGYYDRLLGHVRPDALRVGLAFECQLVDEVPMLDHDEFLDVVVTEAAQYRGEGRETAP